MFTKRNIQVVSELATKQELFDKEREDFDRWKKEQEEIISIKLKKEQKDITVLIESEKVQTKEINKLMEIYNKDKVEFENYKKLENDKILTEKDKILTENIRIDERIQFLSSYEIELKTLKSQADTLSADTEKNIKLTQENEKKQVKINKDIKTELDKLSAVRTVIEKSEKEVIIRENKMSDIEEKRASKEKELLDREKNIKDRESYLNDKEYNLDIKEADLIMEEKRLVLWSKQ